jgi:hypothetical protein
MGSEIVDESDRELEHDICPTSITESAPSQASAYSFRGKYSGSVVQRLSGWGKEESAKMDCLLPQLSLNLGFK